MNTIYKDLATLENRTLNYAASCTYWRLHDSTNLLLFDKQRVEAITQQEIKYETSLKEATIAKQQTVISIQKQRNLWLIISCLVLGLFSLLIYYNQKQKAVIAKQKAQVYVLQLSKLMTDLDTTQQQNVNLQTLSRPNSTNASHRKHPRLRRRHRKTIRLRSQCM